MLLVYDSLTPLGVGILFLVATSPEELIVECESGLKIKIKGSALGLVFPVGGGFTENLKGALHCTKPVGKPGETRYWNSSGVETESKLEADFGASFTSACEEIVPETIPLTANKKIEIMG